MREIKFRAYIKDEESEPGYIYEWNNEFFSDRSPVTGYGSDFPDRNDRNIVLMQYTGIKDKNGKEIYEGDIIKAYSETIKINTGKKTCKFKTSIQTVDWIDDESCFRAINIETKSRSLLFSQEWVGKFFEVIGNIYKNPDLISDY